MPNWCQNVVKISHADPVKMDMIRAADNKEDFFNTIIPRPISESDNWYDWNVSNWGTKWDVVPRITDDNANQITLVFDTAWSPPIEFYRAIIEEHGYEVMAFYNEEGMAFAGIFDNGHDDYYEYANLDSNEIEEFLPLDLDEMFAISSNKADWEEQEMDDGQPDEAQEWHDFDPEC